MFSIHIILSKLFIQETCFLMGFLTGMKPISVCVDGMFQVGFHLCYYK